MMHDLLFILYTWVVRIGNIYVFIGSFFSDKIGKLNKGRQDVWKKLENIHHGSGPVTWIHCASLGEFEQGRPLIEMLRVKYPDSHIALSFFSPSGYELQKDYEFADTIFYLPSDMPENAKKIISKLNPKIVIFVKYEFWWNLIRSLTERDIPVFLISAVFRQKDYFFRPFFAPFLDLLKNYRMIFVQDKNSSDTLKHYQINNHMITGDTRIDRVLERSKEPIVDKRIKEYCHNKTVIVYGSVWQSDMPIVEKSIKRFPDFIHIIAPHDISNQNIKKLCSMISSDSWLYSDIDWHSNVLIINNIGKLGSLYAVAKYAYIGGGFGNGIHNILEPAVFGIPVFFGPEHKKFNEAVILSNEKIAFAINRQNEMIHIIANLEKSGIEYQNITEKAADFFSGNMGATEKTASFLYTYL
jgi:3-deoxy-D-manno-octulosonic-acid transferase